MKRQTVGKITSTVVPLPFWLLTLSSPRSRRARCRMPIRPNPPPLPVVRGAETSKPVPLSPISSRTESRWKERLTDTSLAPACFLMLARASWQMRSRDAWTSPES